MAAAQVALLCCGAAIAQTTSDDTTTAIPAAAGAVKLDTVVVTGQRKALETAQERKRNAEEIIDSVTADEAGKLPDKSITEVLQRVVGVTMDHTRAKMTSGIDESFKFRPEGSGVQTRGLSYGTSTLNGRESFSAGWPGREISWDEVGPELMAGVDVYKNPSSEVIEGGMSSIDLRTKLPFDSKANSGGLSVRGSHSGSGDSPSFSGMYSTRWDSPVGQLGWLVDLAYSKSTYQNDGFGLGQQYPLTDASSGKRIWIPSGFSWSKSDGESERVGLYAALQWKKNDKESSLTYFDSGRRSADSSTSFGIGYDQNNKNIDIYNTVITDGKYDPAGNFQSGTLSYPYKDGVRSGKGANNFAAGGLDGSSTANYSESHSRNRELAWNFKWVINDRWSMQNDLQWVHATNDSTGNQIGLGTFVPNMNLDLTTPRPSLSFTPATAAFLADPNNYYWNIMQPNLNKAEANLYAWKVDGKFKFDDPVLRDVRFGMRLTEREASHTSAGGSGWYSIAEPWKVAQSTNPGNPATTDQLGWWMNTNFPYLSNTAFQVPNGVTTASFPNFFSGKMTAPPNIVVPTMDLVKNYPNAYQSLALLRKALCLQTAAASGQNHGCDSAGSDWNVMSYDNIPITNSNHPGQASVDTHSEGTQAIYGSLRFGFEDWKYPVDGFVGLRVVRTSAVAHGYSTLNPIKVKDLPASVPQFTEEAGKAPIDVNATSIDAIPSLNLKMTLSPTLQTRLAMSQGMARPGFNQLQEYITYDQTVVRNAAGDISQVVYSGGNSGNAKLKPIKSNNVDLSLEWNPRSGQSLTGVVFFKDIKDIIMSDTYKRTLYDTAGSPQDFLITGPANAASMWQAGIEISGMTYLDKIPALEKTLPEWAKGFGISSNVSYLDGKFDLYHPYKSTYCPANGGSDTVLNLYGCDTNGMPYTNLAVPYMSKKAFNVGFMYDHGPFSARLAYSWRDRALVAINAYGSGGGNGTSSDPTRAVTTTVAGVTTTTYPHDVGYGLPVWDEAAGQWDASMSYNITNHMSFSFSVSNLTDTVFLQTNQQTSGQTGRSWNAPGRSYNTSLNYSF
jgi:TonB-dependent receptor